MISHIVALQAYFVSLKIYSKVTLTFQCVNCLYVCCLDPDVKAIDENPVKKRKPGRPKKCGEEEQAGITGSHCYTFYFLVQFWRNSSLFRHSTLH